MQNGMTIPAVENLSVVVDQHLTHEELNVVPLRLGPVLGGYAFDASSADEGQRLMANVPLPNAYSRGYWQDLHS